MSFVQQFIPQPLTSLHTAYRYLTQGKDAKGADKVEKNDFNRAKDSLVSTALAVAGFFALSNYADKLGLSFKSAALLAGTVLPGATGLGTAGYVVCSQASKAFHAGLNMDAAKHVGLAAIAAFTTTPLCSDLVRAFYDLTSVK